MSSKRGSATQSLLRLAILGLSAHSALLRGADDSAILHRASDAYYSLKKEGLAEFRCQVDLDYEALLKSLKAGAAGQDLLPLLKQTHFEVSVNSDGASTVSRRSDVAPPNQQLAERLRLASTGMEQVLTGFFTIWAQFMRGLPALDFNLDYGMDDLDGQYRITQKQGPADLVILMSRELAVTELEVTIPGRVETTVHPQFSKQAKGYLAKSFESTQTIPSGKIELEFAIDYDTVEGFQLPKTVTATLGGTAVPAASGLRIALHFDNYVIKKSN